MKEGLLREDAILSEYMKSKKLDNQNVIVKPCGLFVSKSHHFLAASPDGLVYHANSTEPSSDGLVEVKLVYLNENETLTQGLTRKRIFLPGTTDGDLVMNKKKKQILLSSAATDVCYRENLVSKGVKELPDRSFFLFQQFILILNSGAQCFPNLRHFTMSTLLQNLPIHELNMAFQD